MEDLHFVGAVWRLFQSISFRDVAEHVFSSNGGVGKLSCVKFTHDIKLLTHPSQTITLAPSSTINVKPLSLYGGPIGLILTMFNCM